MNLPDWVKTPTHDFEVSESDLSDYISKYFDRPYRIQQQGNMMSQNEVRFYEVTGSDEGIDGWPSLEMCMKDIKWWLDFDVNSMHKIQFMRECYIYPELAMWHMCRAGLIPAGKYMMTVSW